MPSRSSLSYALGVREAQPDAALDVEAAADLLAAGEVVAFPTETVYGLGALADDERAVRRVFELKRRPAKRALTVHLADAADADGFAARVTEPERRLMERGWPGPLTLVVPARLQVSRLVTGGGATAGLRVPDHPVARELIRAVGRRLGRVAGIAAPSANPFGARPPVTAAQVRAGLGPGRYGVLDGGRCPGGVPSTVLAVSDDETFTVFREGAIPPATLRRWLAGGA